MGRTMLLGVLRMPPELWTDDPLDRMQRHGRYREAADVIEAQDAELAAARSGLDLLSNVLAKRKAQDDRNYRGLVARLGDVKRLVREQRDLKEDAEARLHALLPVLRDLRRARQENVGKVDEAVWAVLVKLDEVDR